MEYGKYLEEDVQQGRQNTAPRRLILFKKAMASAASAIAKEKESATVETRLEKIEWAMAFVRAAERLNLQRMRQCASAYPHISSYCNPEDPNARCSQGFQQLKRHIVELSRESIAEDLEDTAREEDWTLKRQKKKKKQKKNEKAATRLRYHDVGRAE